MEVFHYGLIGNFGKNVVHNLHFDFLALRNQNWSNIFESAHCAEIFKLGSIILLIEQSTSKLNFLQMTQFLFATLLVDKFLAKIGLKEDAKLVQISPKQSLC